jgi:STE24 endopeptidase
VSERRWSVLVVLAGVAAFLAVAAWRIPWHPVPGGPVHPVPETSVFTARQLARAHDYTDPARILGWSSLAVSLLVACYLGFSRPGRRLAERLRGPWWLRVLVAVLALTVIGRLATLPFAIVGHHRSLDYGLTNEAWGPWTSDLVKSLLLSAFVSWLVLLVLIGCARRWDRTWPAIAGAILGLLVMAGSFAYPVLVEPLFNQFTPLPHGQLRTQILKLADEEHVHIDDVLVADASRRTTTLNAYVSGYGSTRRVVLYDNVLHDLPRAQILSIVAHELGHAHHDDVLSGSLLGALGTFGGVGLLGLAVGVIRRRPGEVADPVTVPLVLALMAVGTILSSPVNNAISREIETRADVDALRTTHDSPAFVEVQRQLALHSLSDDPPAWSQFWFGSHPTTLERIAIAHRMAEIEGSARPRG